jgi:hypothetical protein
MNNNDLNNNIDTTIDTTVNDSVESTVQPAPEVAPVPEATPVQQEVPVQQEATVPEVAPVTSSEPIGDPSKNNTQSNTMVCPHCKETIDKGSKHCPKCGKSLGMPTWAKVLIIVGVIFLLVVGCAVSCTIKAAKTVNNTIKNGNEIINDVIDNDVMSSLKKDYSDIHGKKSFKVKETFQNKFGKITMLEVNTNYKGYDEFNEPESGMKFISIKCEVENTGGSDSHFYLTPSLFSASADGEAIKNAYIGENYLNADLSAGTKTVGYMYYEVPINAKKVVLSYDPNFLVDGVTVEFIIIG